MQQQFFVADTENGKYTISEKGDWLVLRPCIININPAFVPANNEITINIASDGVALYGTWPQLSAINIEYGKYSPPSLVIENE